MSRSCAVLSVAFGVACSAMGCGSSQESEFDPGRDAIAPSFDAGAFDDGALIDATQEGAPPGLGFPSGFVFGTAIAGFQADMGCPTLPKAECADPNSDWYVFTTAPETVSDPNAHLSGQDPSVVGPGFWELYADDIGRAADQLHNGALRLSIEWSRIFPTATDAVDGYDALKGIASSAAVARYHDMFAELKKRGLRPLVTLNHYSLPSWIHDAKGCHTNFATCSPKGWVDSARTVKEITKFAAFSAREFGGEVDWWATLNEPLQNMLFGYVQPSADRSHPPAVSLQSDAAKTVFHALIDAHARMYDAIKANDTVDADGDGKPSWIGVVYPFVPISAQNPALFLDTQAMNDIDYLWNRVYLNAVVLGRYDENLDGTMVARDDLKGRMDYVGINWYGGIQVSGLGVSLLPALSPKLTANPFNFQQTPSDPAKLAAFIRYVNVDLSLPAVITENGTVDADDTDVAPRFLVGNLKAVGEAVRAGADVRGYFYWTLTDNYEWNHGMDIRMGLFSVDKNDTTKQRKARHGAAVYGEIAGTHVLSDALISQYATSD